MTNGSAALAFLCAHPGRPTGGSRSSGGGSGSGGKGGAASPGEAPAATATRSSTPSGDLAPSANTFIRKLFQMVTTEDQEIIAFTSDGLSFHVKDPARLEQEVLPKYFRHSRFQSLVRQLNFYDFKKISKERVIWMYRHRLFQAKKPHLLDDLKRKPSASLAKQQTTCTPSSSSSSSATAAGSTKARKYSSSISSGGGGSSKGSGVRCRPQSPFDAACQSDSGGNTTEADYYDDDEDEEEGDDEEGGGEEEEESVFGDGAGSSRSPTGRKRRRTSPSAGSSSSNSSSSSSSSSSRLGLLSRLGSGVSEGRNWYYSDEEETAEAEEEGEQQAVNEELEDEACWVMRGLKAQLSPPVQAAAQAQQPHDPPSLSSSSSSSSSPLAHGPRLALECDEEGPQLLQQEAPEAEDAVALVALPSAVAGGGTEKRKKEEEEGARAATGAGELVDDSSPAPCTSNSEETPTAAPAASSSYQPSAGEAKAWARVQALWAAAGEWGQTDLYAQLPSSDHAAWAGFFLAMGPFHPGPELVRACRDLLVACPPLADAVQRHRRALDPLGPSRPRHPSDVAFPLGGSGSPAPPVERRRQQQEQQQQQHNNRALRDVLGFGLNHLAEAAATLSEDDARPAAAALRGCLAEWRPHVGRLL